MSGSVGKVAAERNQKALIELVAQPGNDVCADCKSKAPRWASYNLGIFICVRCASIHRKIGTHISKIKSLSLDSWSKDQVEVMRTIGNIKSNQKYNPDERRHPPPISMEESERDSELEKYIRAKYEYKRFIPQSVQASDLLGPSQSKSSSVIPPPRSKTAPIHDYNPRSNVRASTMNTATSTHGASALAPVNPPPRTTSQPQGSSRTSVYLPSSAALASTTMTSNNSNINNTINNPFPLSQIQPQIQNQAKPITNTSSYNSNNPLWNDLASLQSPSVDTSLPLQFASAPGSASSFTSQPGFPTNTTTSAQLMSPTYQTNPSIPVPISAPANTNPYANLSLTSSDSFSTGPAFPSSFGSNISIGGNGQSPNTRSFSLPVFSNANVGGSPTSLMPMPTGLGVAGAVQHSQPQPIPYNPFNQLHAQQQQQQFLSATQPIVQPNSSPNPFTQQFTNSQSYIHPSMTTQPQQSPYTTQIPLPSPGISYITSNSPSSYHTSSSYPFQQQQQPQLQQATSTSYNNSSPSPFAQQAQQAQQLFQGMVSNTNPFHSYA